MSDANRRTTEDGTVGDDDELTPEERMAFADLPREAQPPDLMEERVVRALRDEGILRSASPRGAALPGPVHAGWFRSWMIPASMAASLVLFGAGLVTGHWMGTRGTTQAFLAVRDQDAAELALRIQEAGSAYVSALAALGELRGSDAQGTGAGAVTHAQAASEMRQGREAALGALYGAAFELARMAPGDAEVVKILQILEERRSRDLGSAQGRNVVWF